jgi:hypothetical protein
MSANPTFGALLPNQVSFGGTLSHGKKQFSKNVSCPSQLLGNTCKTNFQRYGERKGFLKITLLLRLGVLALDGNEDGDVSIGVFPEAKKA